MRHYLPGAASAPGQLRHLCGAGRGGEESQGTQRMSHRVRLRDGGEVAVVARVYRPRDAGAAEIGGRQHTDRRLPLRDSVSSFEIL